jgi:aconitate hydratase
MKDLKKIATFAETLTELDINNKTYKYFNITKLGIDTAKLPFTLKILLENVLRHQVNNTHKLQENIEGFVDWLSNNGKTTAEIDFMPSRVLMQDFTGVPAVVDLAAMRDALAALGGDPARINPKIPVDLVIDHSLQVDYYGTADALQKNIKLEMQRNKERYEFLRWGAQSFKNLRVIPPGVGICHQINIEYLATVVMQKDGLVFPDTLVGTDSHTTMVNALGVLGWGVGGIEAEAAMLGDGLAMVIPQVVGVKIIGALNGDINATDLVLIVTQMLRKHNVVGKFVEFYGPGLKYLSLADRATIANMAPEYGATCGFFPIDQETLNYLELTNRSAELIKLVEVYAKAQGLWHQDTSSSIYCEKLQLDLSSITSGVSGPKRPQDRLALKDISSNFKENISQNLQQAFSVKGQGYNLHNGSVVIAAITSCTNTSNPYAMIGAGLIAKNLYQAGLKVKPWVKASFAPGSQVVVSYLKSAGLDVYLDAIGFNLVGFGCTTCIGNSGPLLEEIQETITNNNLQVASITSGNRNFEGRIHPAVKANYLASPLLVVAYAIIGSIDINIQHDLLGTSHTGEPIYLKDVWPSKEEIAAVIGRHVKRQLFEEKYSNVFRGDADWNALLTTSSKTYDWQKSTYINSPPYFCGIKKEPQDFKEIKQARILAILGDSITTDHISPAGNIAKQSPAARYLLEQGISVQDFNSYGARRGNHEVMIRGTFANIRIKNQMCQEVEGGFTKSIDNQIKSIYDAAMEYKNQDIPLIVIAGKEYATGSSRDWAAKGTMLLGIRAVIAESFERIGRSNLVGMGVLPLRFCQGITHHDLKLNGSEVIDLALTSADIKPYQKIRCFINDKEIELELQVFTDVEAEYVKHETILHKVVRQELLNIVN